MSAVQESATLHEPPSLEPLYTGKPKRPMALKRAIAAIEIATPIAETIPVIGTPIKGALEAMGKILKYAAEVKSNKEMTKELAEHAATWLSTLINTLDSIKEDHAELERLRDQVDGMLRVLTIIQEWMALRTRQRLLQRTWNKSEDSEELVRLRERLHDAFERFMLASQIRVQHSQAQIQHSQVHIQSSLATVISDTDRDTLNSLGPVPAARYDSLVSPPGCLEGTRVDVVAGIIEWCAQLMDHFSIYWLAGHAGTGKSTIAKTFCEQLVRQGNARVVTFFVSKNSAERRDPLRILYTWACELAFANVAMRKLVLEGIRSQPDIKQRPLKEQVHCLLVAAIEEATKVQPLILVIDALDECFKTSGVEGGGLVRELSQALCDLPVKLVVTSRLEDSLCRMFDSLPGRITQYLHEIEADKVATDVRLILQEGFKDIVTSHEITFCPWPSEEEIDLLTSLTGRLIIYASTVLKFVGNRHFSPQARLKQLLERSPTSGKNSIFTQLDSLYLNVLLTAAYDEAIGQTNDEICARLRRLIGAVILLQEPMSVAALATLIDVSADELARDVRALAAVLFVGPEIDDAGQLTVRIFHPSFRDFLLDHQRCGDVRFLVISEQQHQHLIENPTLANDKVDNPSLSVRLREHVSPSLRYSCSHWIAHLLEIHVPSEALASVLCSFTRQHGFHWLELISLLGQVFYISAWMSDAVLWCQKYLSLAGLDGDVTLLMVDIHRTIFTYQNVLRTHASHVYLSVLLTMPQCSLLDTIGKTAESPLYLLSSRKHAWEASQVVMEGHQSLIMGIAIAPDGKKIVSGSDDGTIRIWNARNGQNYAILGSPKTLNENSIYSVAFSPTGRMIASGHANGTVRLWDVVTEQQISVFPMHTDIVTSIAYSPNSAWMVSGSHDHSIAIWDVQARQARALPEAHCDWVKCVAVSPNGRHIASSSLENVIRIWDVNDRQQIATLSSEEDYGCHSIAFSPDGGRLASGSRCNDTVRIWDLCKGEEIATLRPEGEDRARSATYPDWHVWAVAFSSDGLWIASGSSDSKVRIWNALTGQQIFKFEGHTSDVVSVTFTPNQKCVISGSEDGTTIRLWPTDLQFQEQLTRSCLELRHHKDKVIAVTVSPDGRYIASCSWGLTENVKLWNAATSEHICTYEGHIDSVEFVSFSPCSTQLVSASRDQTALVWDVLTGRLILTLQGHSAGVFSAVFAPNGEHIASGSDDHTIIIWDTQTGEQISKLEGHCDRVHVLVISSDSTLIASCSWDDTVRLWDMLAGHQVTVLDVGNGCSLSSLNFTSNDRHLVGRYWNKYLPIAWDISDFTQLSSPNTELQGREDEYDLWLVDDTDWIRLYSAYSGYPVADLCWLPKEYRPCHGTRSFVVTNNVLVLGTETGRLTFIDFTGFFEKLKHLHVVLESSRIRDHHSM